MNLTKKQFLDEFKELYRKRRLLLKQISDAFIQGMPTIENCETHCTTGCQTFCQVSVEMVAYPIIKDKINVIDKEILQLGSGFFDQC